jgi:hypothetical protein
VRIAGVRLGAPVARLLAEIVQGERYPETAARLVGAIDRRITVEARLTLADHQAIIECLSRNCPPTLGRLRQELDDERRYVRRVTGA